MRIFVLVLSLFLLHPDALACSCFSPEQRAKTADDALHIATLAVFARVKSVDTQGNATITVLESFKGPAAGMELQVLRDADECGGRGFVVNEETMLLSFKPVATACDKYAADHYLVQEFRLRKRP